MPLGSIAREERRAYRRQVAVRHASILAAGLVAGLAVAFLAMGYISQSGGAAEKYEKLDEGMTLEAVEIVMGGNTPSTEGSTTPNGTTAYKWLVGNNEAVTVLLQNGRVVGKSKSSGQPAEAPVP